MTTGAVFGFEATSDVPLRLTRSGSGLPLRITTHSENKPTERDQLVVEWKPRAGHPFHGRVYQDVEGRYRIWTNDAGWYLVDTARNVISVPTDTEELQREVRLWSTPTMLLLLSRGGAVLHASAVQVGNRAVLFGGPSRFGKTTLAAGFHVHGHRVLAEDTTCVVQVESGLHVLPGPALLRVRHDVARMLNLSEGTSIGEDEQRVFFVPNDPGTADPVPLAGLCFLRGEHQLERIEPVAAGPEILPDLWALSFKLPTEADFSRSLSLLVDLTQSTSFWNLRRSVGRADLFDAVDEIVRMML